MVPLALPELLCQRLKEWQVEGLAFPKSVRPTVSNSWKGLTGMPKAEIPVFHITEFFLALPKNERLESGRQKTVLSNSLTMEVGPRMTLSFSCEGCCSFTFHHPANQVKNKEAAKVRWLFRKKYVLWSF